MTSSRRSVRGAVLVAAATLPLAAAGGAQAQVPLGPECQPASISGTARDGATLTARRGSCSGTPAPAVTLQWFLCHGETCTARTRQIRTSSIAYKVVEGDVNGRLVVQQVAENNFGTDLDNTTTDIVAAIPPSATPTISGAPREGEQLLGSEGFLSGTRPAVAAVQWLRCEADGTACVAITGTATRRYALRADDVGKAIRFQVTLTGPQHTVYISSDATGPIEAIPPPPPPPTQPGPRQPAAPTPLSPFPVVLIAGRAFPARAVVSTLLVRGPRGARVTVVCRGRSCPARRQRRRIRGGTIRLRRFERSLAAGTVIEIRVTSKNRIGKFTRLRILGERPPARTDLCVRPGRSRPVSCPGGVG